MPNYCDNDLIVLGTPDELARFKEIAKGENGVIDFNSFIPYPDTYVQQDKNPIKNEKGHFVDGYNNGGYEWCIENWGTKWNACGKIVPKETKRSLKYTFETAWAPPIPVVTAMSKRCPSLTFKLAYYERGIGFSGKVTLKDGTVLEDIYNEKYRGSRGG